MTLLNRLFNKKTTTKPPVSKKQKIATLERSVAELDQLSDDEMVNIAAGEYEYTLRVAAIGKLPYGDTLRDLAFSEASRVQLPARERLAALLDSNDLAFEQLNTETADKAALLAVASFSKQIELQEQVLDSAEDETFFYKVALDGASVKLRQTAAQRITKRDKLEQLLKQSKGKDKTVYRIVKEKCDLFKEQDKREQALASKTESLCQALERLSQRAWDPMFSANVIHFKEQWLSIKELNSQCTNEFKQRIEQSLLACQNIIDEQTRQQAELEAKQRAVANAESEREAIVDRLRQLIVWLYDIEDEQTDEIQGVAKSLLEQQQLWQQSIEHLPASKEQQSVFHRTCEGIVFLQQKFTDHGPFKKQLACIVEAEGHSDKSVITALRERLNTAALLDESQCPEQIQTATDLIALWDKKQQEEKNNFQQQMRQIGGLIRRATETIDRGKIRQAVGIRRTIEQKIGDLKKVPVSVSEQLERLDEKLTQLQDWRSYAVQPKMEELVDKMQALVDGTISPELQAEKIKNLQEQWKMLSVGGGSQHQDLWEKFHQLAQTAYEPCKVYFQQQADIREENLQKRKNLVLQLADFGQQYDWDSADWKMVEKMARLARQEWRDYSPTDRSATKAVQAEFDKQLDIIYQHLDGEYKKNTDYKQQLVEQAQCLAESEDVRTSVEEVKKLQAKWKTIGVTARKQDQVLWKAFRSHCDSVFEKRQQQSAQFKEQLNENKRQAEAVCEEIQNLSALEGKQLLDARTELERLQSAFGDIGTMPKNSINAIKAKFSAAIEQFEKKIEQQRKQDKGKIWDNLFDANETVVRCELAVHSGDDIEQCKQVAQQFIDTIEQWPKGGKEAINKKLTHITAGASIDFSANETLLRHLCIRMEILTEAQTPQSDQAMRMAYQVERLQHGLGQNTALNKNSVADLVFEWIAGPPVSLPIYDELLQRFNACRKSVI